MSIYASTTLHTQVGELRANYHESSAGECLTLSVGEITTSMPLLTRLHSACLFGETLGDNACDCGPQLHTALAQIATEGRGVLVYLFQEGRGIGLKEKVRALALQENGLNTIESMHALGYQSDERNYMAAVFALRDLQVPDQIRLMSNNPAKQQGLKDGGFEIVEEVKLSYTLSAKAHANLQGKVALMGHTVDFSQLSMPKDE